MKFKSNIDLFDKSELKTLLIDFFDDSKNTNLRSITSLALFLKVSKKAINDYPDEGKFYDMIQYAKLRCEEDIVQKMLNGKLGLRQGELILKKDFGFGEQASKSNGIKSSIRTISSILDEIEKQS